MWPYSLVCVVRVHLVANLEDRFSRDAAHLTIINDFQHSSNAFCEITMSNSRRESARNQPDPTSPTPSKVQNVKLVLLGDQGVGKSSIALRYVRGEFTENSEATIGGK